MPMPERILIKNALIVTMNANLEVVKGDILINENIIEKVGNFNDENKSAIFNADGLIVVPGFIQTHVHLCQALFRNLADDLPLLDWLAKKILPFENRHTPESLRASSRLALAELIKGGTTTIMDFGTTRYQDVIFEELASCGIRAYAGKTMMDKGNMPKNMKENTQASLAESEKLANKWHNFDEGRLKYAFAPRFVLSCTEELLVESGSLAKKFNTLLHTHASENRRETELVIKQLGQRNIIVFDKLGLADNNLCLAHCIWTDDSETALLKERNIKVLHCPSANLKLGSGVAPIPNYISKGITVSLGADGAPCNNNMDMFNEMRLASLIQKPVHGPEAMSAQDTFKLATVNGANTLALDNIIGSIEPGKAADLTFIRNNQVHSIPYENIYSKLVYSSYSSDVENVMINGKWVLKEKKLVTIDENKLLDSIEQQKVNFGIN
jgi:5-methylthioadenosine/S-adenosylhomocysteine deaminase